MTAYERLEDRFRQISHLGDARAILHWDEAVTMPVGSGDARNRSLAELGAVIQGLASDAAIGPWLDEAEAAETDPWRAANLRRMRHAYVESTAVPADLNRRLTLARGACEQSWRALRAANDWAGFRPHLAEVLKLTREGCGHLADRQGLSIYDAALAQFSPGLTTAVVETLFDELKSFLPALITRVIERQARETVVPPKGSFPVAAQKALGTELMSALGFSFEIGRLDESHHPFCGGTPRDVRVTTRYSEHEFLPAMMGIVHETGHALYEQHLPTAWLAQPVGQAAGMAVHESQSLMIEMQVARSKEFMRFAGPRVRARLGAHAENPDALTDENLGRLTTRVRRGFIRVDADEVTYPMHVILRFELERALLEGQLALEDLPDAWDERMTKYLGLSTRGNDRDGCMQDVHWPAGMFGYFPAYTFGAVIAAQLFQTARRAAPALPEAIARGDFKPLRDWLEERVWSQGSRLGTLDLVEAASGPLSTAPFREHLERRYLNHD